MIFSSVFYVKCKNEPKERRVKSFTAVPTHIITDSAVVGENSLQGSEKAYIQGIVKKNHSVAVFKSHRYGSVIVAVDYPVRLFQLIFKYPVEGFTTDTLPVAGPLYFVEMY